MNREAIADDNSPVAQEPSLGRPARRGTPAELAVGTFTAALQALVAGQREDAAVLVEVSLLEADELRDIYGRWPDEIAEWLLAHGVSESDVTGERSRLDTVLDRTDQDDIELRWPDYASAATQAANKCRAKASDPADAAAAVRAAHACWLSIHDAAVDHVSGMVDVAVRLAGENQLGALWDHLMSDWYDAHERRYSLENQRWSESARQLTVAIFDGFHAHLVGPDRSGAVEVITEDHRTGFRFAPCGSGGRSVGAGITGGQPRAAAPYGFAVTTEPHDWAWNTVGICSYCVHCCQLNELMPIDRLGYPTRVIDPPTWPSAEENPACTWWVYDDPSLVPDAVYERVGRTRPKEFNR